ncbi:MAG: serine/threonine protein kinase [Myxococcales bacterium]|nr:serine/threonine protein kinase [Myxococcales bacterium]
MVLSSAWVDRSEAGRKFLQRRVASYGFFGASLGFFFVAARVVDWIASPDPGRSPTHPSMVFHVLGASALLLIWLVCRRRTRSMAFIRTTDVLGTFLACMFYAIMGHSLPAGIQPNLVILLVLSFGLTARAIYVPSSSGRTGILTAVCGIPLLIVTYHIYFTMDLAPWEEVFPAIAGESNRAIVRHAVFWTAVWWTCTVVVCTSASRVIYGLRREVHDARELGQYTLIEKLGEGGMGIVYRAEHAMLRRPTALKVLPAAKAGTSAIARFETEVQVTAMLTHPNTVTIFDFGRTPEGMFYYAMEHLDGATLADVVDVDGPQPPARVVWILRQAAAALSEAHALNLVHRDIKPTNIMLLKEDSHADMVKVLDFGLVKELEHADGYSPTEAGAIAGTPQYLPPESITAAGSVDARADIYALGAVGYFLLTGSHVFDGATVIEVCSNHLHTEPVPPSERVGRAIPRQLEALIMSCLAKNPDDRPQSADEMRVALASCAGVGEWTEADARSWWARYGSAIRKRRDQSKVSLSGVSIGVDMRARLLKARRRLAS